LGYWQIYIQMLLSKFGWSWRFSNHKFDDFRVFCTTWLWQDPCREIHPDHSF
jgi:hypothetical protein